MDVDIIGKVNAIFTPVSLQYAVDHPPALLPPLHRASSGCHNTLRYPLDSFVYNPVNCDIKTGVQCVTCYAELCSDGYVG